MIFPFSFWLDAPDLLCDGTQDDKVVKSPKNVMPGLISLPVLDTGASRTY